MNKYIGQKLYYFYNGSRVRFRSQPITLINTAKLFILKMLMASFFCGALFLFKNPEMLGGKAVTMSAFSSSVIMGVCFLYLVNRKLLRMGI